MKGIAAAAAALLLAGCRMVPDRETVTFVPVPGSPGVFMAADSLILEGEFDGAEGVLLAMLDDGRFQDLRYDIFWRLFGLYNGRGMPDAGRALFERLEQAGYGDLTGWQVSLLDMSRRPADALPLVPSDDTLLRLWLSRDMGEPEMPAIIPAPVDMAGRYVRVMLAPEGSLTPEQTLLAAADAVYLPLLDGRLCTELALRVRSGSDWVDELISLMGESEAKAAIEAERMAFLRAGDTGYWEDMLDRGEAAAGIAARVLLEMDPARYGTDWRISDALVASGDTATAGRLAAATSDPVFAAGVRMALDLEAERYQAVLDTCDAVDPLAPDVLRARADLYRARALRASGSARLAYAAYRDFAASWPWHPTAREAAYLAGRYYDSEQEWAAAADAYLVSLRASGTWEGDERGCWRCGFCFYMSGQGARGDSLWQAATVRWPYGYWRDEMLFWRARYASRTGDREAERRLLEQVASEHPWEFYGMLASMRLGGGLRLRLAPTTLTLADHRETAMAMDMCSRGYGVLAAEMLRNGECGDPGVRAVALGLMGQHGGSITVLRDLDTRLREENRSMLPESLLCWYFPSPYGELSEAVTDTMHLSAAIVQGIMREESYFDRWVVSGAGARGLIQLMPGTAYDVARWNGLPFLGEEQFFEPANSILYGALYINRQWLAFGGEPALFLAAYNAGPGNASRWIDMHGWDPSDPELFIEQITYRETRIYVKKVLRSSWIYERIRS
jgi:hypothetical protein